MQSCKPRPILFKQKWQAGEIEGQHHKKNKTLQTQDPFWIQHTQTDMLLSSKRESDVVITIMMKEITRGSYYGPEFEDQLDMEGVGP